MSVKKMYCYLFYVFYKLWAKIDKGFGATGPFPTDMKAAVFILAIEIWILFSIFFYYCYFFKTHPYITFFSPQGIVPFCVLFFIKWFVFWKDDQWKNYVKEFDRWPKEKNRKGVWIVVAVVFFVISNFVISFYLSPERV
jgi:hypothetical protein